MKILLTGASGFLGRAIKQKMFSNEFYSISHGLDFKKNGNDYYLDLSDDSHIQKLMESLKKVSFNILIHLAAITPFNGHFDFEKDTIITKNISLLCNILRIPTLVFTSGWVVYDPKSIPPLKEKTPLKPGSDYGLSKLWAEEFFKSSLKETTFINLRLSIVYGPGQTSAGLIPNIVKAGIQSREIVINSQFIKRDYLYIYNFIAALNKLLKDPIQESVDLNIGSGSSLSILEVAENVQEIFDASYNKKLRIKSEKMSAKEMHDNKLDISLSLKLLGDYNSVSFKEGLKQYIKWSIDENIF